LAQVPAGETLKMLEKTKDYEIGCELNYNEDAFALACKLITLPALLISQQL